MTVPPDDRRGSSRRRYRAYLKQRRADFAADKQSKAAAKPGTGAAGGAEGPARARDWTVDPSVAGGNRRAHRSFWTLLREFLGLLRGDVPAVALALGTLTLATLVGLVMPLSTKLVFDYVLLDTPGPKGIPAWLGLPTERTTLLWLNGAAMVALAVLGLAVGTVGRYQMTRLTRLVQVTVRRQVFEHLSRLPLHRLHALKSGGVTSILREDAGLVGEMLFSVLYNPLRAVVTLLGGLTALAVLDWRMLLGGLMLIPAVYYTHRTWIGRIRPIHRAIKQNRQSTDAHATEAFSGIRVVRAFSRRRAEAARFSTANHLMARQDMLIWWWSRGIEAIWSVLIPAATAGVLVYGGHQVLRGNLTIGDVAAFGGYLLMLLGPLEVLVSTASTLQNSLAAWDRCLDVLAEPTELGGGDAKAERARLRAGGGVSATDRLPVDPARVAGAVAMRGVAFAYPGRSERVLEGIDLDVAAGETVALVGASGSGKTTLCNLVARFFDPTEGAVLLDGVDLRRLDADGYRRLLGIVEQDVFLFDGTIAENIAYADRGAPRERIVAAAAAANADGFIEATERGYETVIGERGVRLSGGQKQRIAIARALLADPRILILDEATSNLDSESERLIQQSLERLMRGRTCFVIAHRLSTIRKADRIVVLEKGRIVEQGTHEQLVAREGRYWEMLNIQLHTAKDYAA